jgi:hypothetical protein
LFCWYWRNCWLSLFKLSFVLLILEELLTVTAETFFCFVDIGENVDHQCLDFSICSYWWNCWPSLFKFLCFVDIGGIVDQHSLNFLCFVDIGGIVDHQCLNFLCFVDIGRIVDHHCLNFLCFVDYAWIVVHHCLNISVWLIFVEMLTISA